MLSKARACKEALSASDEWIVALPVLCGHGPSSQQTWAPGDIDAATAPVLKRLWEPLRRLAEGYKLMYARCPFDQHSQHDQNATDRFAPPPRRVSQLVLVGGSTKSPCIRRFAEELAGRPACSGVDAEHAVALGAAVHAGLMQGSIAGLEMTDSVYSKGLQDRVSGFQL